MWSEHDCSVADIEERRQDTLRDFLRDYDHADVIAALGRSDLLEAIGLEDILAYVQAVGFGPVGPHRALVRSRVGSLAAAFEYGG